MSDGEVIASRLGGNIKQLREARGLTQQQIAKLEHPDANPSIDTLEVVARALGARAPASPPRAPAKRAVPTPPALC